MTSKGITLTVLLGILAIIYAIYFMDWFKGEEILITAQLRPGGRPAKVEKDGTLPEVYPVSFAFRRKHEFTSIRVVTAEELKASKYPRPLWHLISDNHSRPTKAIVYGKDVEGMKPYLPNAKAEPLEPHVSYVIIVETDDGKKGQTNFMTKAVSR